METPITVYVVELSGTKKKLFVLAHSIYDAILGIKKLNPTVEVQGAVEYLKVDAIVNDSHIKTNEQQNLPL